MASTAPALRMPSGPSEAALDRAARQPVLFAALPKRSDLLRLGAQESAAVVTMHVHRNHSFEHVASAMAPFAGFAGLDVRLEYGDYDDSLAMDDAPDADVELVWLDWSRYGTSRTPADLAEWLRSRVMTRRPLTESPILVAGAPAADPAGVGLTAELEKALASVPAVHVCDLASIGRQLGDRLFDTRAARLSGTPLSDAACVLAARLFGLRWIPSVVRPPLKAVVVDLDDTLYRGVLGEDGAGGVELSDAHRDLQARLVSLREAGMFIAVASRNEAGDVEELFATRTDFPLRREHLSACEVSWEPKADAIRRVASQLRIGTDAVVFLDDNAGELAAVAADVPRIATLHAGADPAVTLRALDLFPGLWRWRRSEADAVRIQDLAASREREALAATAADPLAYLASLQPHLLYGLNPGRHLSRLHELSVKTNQFNLALARLAEAEVARRIAAPDHVVVSVRLSDRLTDSGLIAAIFGRRDGDTLVVEELCISCRALGRRLEDLLIGEAIARMTAATGTSRVVMRYALGSRNAPARAWLARAVAQPLGPGAGEIPFPWSGSSHAALVSALPVTIDMEPDDGA